MEIKPLVVGPLLTNCYLLVSKKEFLKKNISSEPELLIIDPGGETEKILEEINKIKGKVKYIINTHFHWDHTLGNKIIKKLTGAKILIHEAEKNFINFKANQFLKEGDEIKIGKNVLKVFHVPGHSRGSICLAGAWLTCQSRPSCQLSIIDNQPFDFIFTGDTLFKNGYGRTDLPGGSEKDLKKSLERLTKILKSGMTVYPGHGEIFEIK